MVIVRRKGKYCLLSRKSRRNLGCYRTRKGAENREREVAYFRSHPRRREVHVRDHRRRAPERPYASEFARRDPVRRQRPIRFECPIERSEVSGGDLHAGFYVYAMKKPEIGEGKVRGQVHPIPEDVKERLLAAKTPREMEAIIAEAEPRLAAMDNRSFLDCDEAANLMIAALRAHRIPHIMVIGESDEGSSHAYVIVDGRRYDPTHQGYGDGHIESATRWP